MRTGLLRRVVIGVVITLSIFSVKVRYECWETCAVCRSGRVHTAWGAYVLRWGVPVVRWNGPVERSETLDGVLGVCQHDHHWEIRREIWSGLLCHSNLRPLRYRVRNPLAITLEESATWRERISECLAQGVIVYSDLEKALLYIPPREDRNTDAFRIAYKSVVTRLADRYGERPEPSPPHLMR